MDMNGSHAGRSSDAAPSAASIIETHHRVRNLLAMIRSIVRRTATSHSNVEDYAAHLSGRIDALARTQAWFDFAACKGVDLEEMIRDELRSQSGHETQVEIAGPPVELPPRLAPPLALALHELATNAIKFGALGTDSGRLRVVWRVEGGDERGDWLVLAWQEVGVAIRRRPRKRGFGHELITQRVPYELSGRGSMDFAPSGVSVEIAIPLEQRGADARFRGRTL